MSRSAPTLVGQTVLVLGGSSGIGLATARRAREQGADVILTARDPERLHRIGLELGASIAAFDLGDADRLMRFFANLPGPIDHVLLSGGAPQDVPFAELDAARAREGLERIVLTVQIARLAKDAVQPMGSLLLIDGTGGRRPSAGPLIAAVAAAMPALVRSLALALAPIRVNLLAPGFVVQPEDIAALAVDVMANPAITGATLDIDGGRQLVET